MSIFTKQWFNNNTRNNNIPLIVQGVDPDLTNVTTFIPKRILNRKLDMVIFTDRYAVKQNTWKCAGKGLRTFAITKPNLRDVLSLRPIPSNMNGV